MSEASQPRAILQAEFDHRGRHYVALFQAPDALTNRKTQRPYHDCSAREVKNGEPLATMVCRFKPDRGCYDVEPILLGKGERPWTKREVATFKRLVRQSFESAKPIEWKGHECGGDGAPCPLCQKIKRELDENNERVRAKVQARKQRHKAEGYDLEEAA